jgi:hypothetical protein
MQMWDNRRTELTELPVAHPSQELQMSAVTKGITKDHLFEVYSDPYITKVGHDHRPAAYIDHPAVTYLSAWIGSTFAGAFMAVRFSPIEIELHAFLKRSALEHSRALGVACLEWAFAQPIQRVTAYIIEGLESAKNYCLKLGFKEEGRRRAACMQGGIIKDVYVLGMTRLDWSSK